MRNMDQNMRHLARRVSEERSRRHWTQAELGEHAGVSEGTVSNFEREKTTPQPAKLRKMLAALGLEDEAGDATASETRSEWEPDVKAFLDVMGIYLSAMEPEARASAIRDITRQIVAGR